VPHRSDVSFRVLHALRVKGFAKTEVLAELAGLGVADVEGELVGLSHHGWAAFREARSLWQLTPDGRRAHAEAMAHDVYDPELRGRLGETYPTFLSVNERFKELCGEWQLKDGSPNDHADTAYDRQVIERLLAVDHEVQPLCRSFAEVMDRFAAYGPRLRHTAERVDAGAYDLFTGVMCGSYHDVWMELHEDLILTLGIDRAKEGSF
jgi:hypothetical protein